MRAVCVFSLSHSITPLPFTFFYLILFFLLLFSTEKRRVPLLPSGYYTLYSMPCEFKNLCDSLSSSFVYNRAGKEPRIRHVGTWQR
jgi:hypothetical protein